MFSPTVWDVAMFVGTLGFFFTGMAVFVKFVPMIPIAEMKHLLHLERHSKHEAEVVEAKA
jgi:molybdopterin-containing oxidoreductase family membrane subunit